MSKKYIVILIMGLLLSFFLIKPAFAGPICTGWGCLKWDLLIFSPLIALGLLITGFLGWAFRRSIIFALIAFAGLGYIIYVSWIFIGGQRSDKETRQRQIRDIQNLPFDVYKIDYLPEGTEIENYGISFYYKDLDTARVSVKIKKTDNQRWPSNPDSIDKWKEYWAEVTQAKAKESLNFPDGCPSNDYEQRIIDGGSFSENCHFVTTTAGGHELYMTKFPDYIDCNIISLKKNDTIIIIEFYRPFQDEDIKEISRVVDWLTIFTSEELKIEQEREFKKTD